MSGWGWLEGARGAGHSPLPIRSLLVTVGWAGGEAAGPDCSGNTAQERDRDPHTHCPPATWPSTHTVAAPPLLPGPPAARSAPARILLMTSLLASSWSSKHSTRISSTCGSFLRRAFISSSAASPSVWAAPEGGGQRTRRRRIGEASLVSVRHAPRLSSPTYRSARTRST